MGKLAGMALGLSLILLAAAHGRPKPPLTFLLAEKRGVAFLPRFSTNC
jgi:hypothetical protein